VFWPGPTIWFFICPEFPVVQDVLAKCTGVSLGRKTLSSLRASLACVVRSFVRLVGRGPVRSRLPPFVHTDCGRRRACDAALDAVFAKGGIRRASHKEAVVAAVFWTLARVVREFGLPFDLIIGVNRKVYPGAFFPKAQDLYELTGFRLTPVSRICFNTFFDSEIPRSRFWASVKNSGNSLASLEIFPT